MKKAAEGDKPKGLHQKDGFARVLVVDDEASIRITFRAFLLKEGYEVEVAEDATQALALLSKEKWDVVVTDIILPDISGLELLKAIHASSPGVEVIMMTGVPSVETASEAVRNGASDYLVKPVLKQDIIRCVATAARIKALDDERRSEQAAKERSQKELQATVSRLTEANDQLRLAAVFREEIEQVARHDLKGPLHVILSAPEVIRMKGSGLSGDQLAWLEKIESAGQRLFDMINLSLALYKMEQKLYTMHPEGVDLLSVVRELTNHHAALLGAKDLSVSLVIDERAIAANDAFVIQGERLLCYSMLGNLLKNALEASPNGQVVTIRFETGDPMRIRIRNHGSVPESIRDRFFDKFSTGGKKNGTGLGTYSARMIARLHGAEITLDTSIPDETTVTVCFPKSSPGERKEMCS